jgi:cobaltochelatase CobN
MLAELAGAHGVKIDTRYSEKLPASTDASVFNGYDIVMFDAPRDHIREAIQAQLHHALSGKNTVALAAHQRASLEKFT